MSLYEYLSKHYSANSVKRYERLIERYQLSVQIQTVDQAGVLAYLGDLRRWGLHAKSVRNHLAAIKIYHRYLQSEGLRSDHPCADLRLRDPINRQVILEGLYGEQELELLVAAFADARRSDRILLSLLVHQALSTSELRALKRSDIDLQTAQVHIREQTRPGRRGNASRTLALTDKQLEELSTYLPASSNDHLLCTTTGGQLWTGYVHRLLRQYAPGYQAKKIRQSVIANLLKAGHDLRLVQAFAGHRRTSSTEQYRRDGLEQLRSAIEKHHPLG